MNINGESVRFVRYGTFKDLYKFKRGDGTCFYVDRDGIQARLERLMNLGESRDETERALKLHP